MVHTNQSVQNNAEKQDGPATAGVLEAFAVGDIDGVLQQFNGDGHEPKALTWMPERGQLPSEMMGAFYQAWCDMPRTAENDVPNVKNFDVFKFRTAMGFMVYMDVIDGGQDFRFRVFGSRIVDFVGFDWTGRLVSEMPMKALCRDYLLACYRAILHRKEPLYTKHRLKNADTIIEWDRVLVPLADSKQPIARILGLSVPNTLSPSHVEIGPSSF
jgi:hypothetical protein